jgi:hypothetical protein
VKNRRIDDATEVPACPCPHCKRMLDRASDPQSAASPRPGDFSLCVYCGAVLRFTETMLLRATTLRERSDAPPKLVKYAQAIAFVRRSQKSKERAS